MATQKKKTSSQRNRGTSKKTNSSGKRSSGKGKGKQSQGPDLLSIIVVVIAVVLVIVLISKFSKDKDGVETGNPTGSVTATGTVTPDAPTDVPDEITKVPEATKPVTVAPTPTVMPTPTPVPTPTEKPMLTETEAKKIATKIVQLDTYSIELLDDHLMIDGAEYYAFCINDENGTSMSPLLIVEKTEGALLCYDLSGVVAPIEKFPLDKTETGGGGEKPLTAEEAKQILAGYSAAALGLAKEPSAYEMTVDDWTTLVEGKDCYGINLFETTDGKQRLRGTFYVVLDGSAVYSQDDVTGDFIKR